MSDGINLAVRTGTEHDETLAESVAWSIEMEKKPGIDQFRDALKDLKTKRGGQYWHEQLWKYLVEESELVGKKEATNLPILFHNLFVAHPDWGAVRTAIKHIPYRIRAEGTAEGFTNKMKPVVEAFDKLKENFDDITERLIRCAHFEKVLGNLERSLQKDGRAKYLRWTIANLRAVLNFNYPEDLKRSHLSLVDVAIKMVERKGMAVDRGDSRDIRRRLINSRLSLLPTSKRAIAEFGDGESVDEQE